MGSLVSAQQSLTISDGSVLGLGGTSLSVSMDANLDVQGFVLAIGYDDSMVTATGIGTSGLASTADLMVPEILPGGATLGVVMDSSPPFTGATIPAGSGVEIATIELTPKVVVTADTLVTIAFTDGTLNTPPLDNLIVQGGLSVGAGDGLGLNNGILTLLEPPPASMIMENGSAPADGTGTTGDARVLLDNSLGGVQGFVTAVTHDPAVITLEAISSGAATNAANAEFQLSNLYTNGGTLGVVLDFVAPFGAQTIPIGNGQHLATYTYSCNNANVYVLGEPGTPPPPESSTLALADDTLGEPRLDNVIVVAGLSVSPLLESGNFTCEPVGIPAEDTTLWMETAFEEGAG
ncbi:MAG: hypothetical protein OSB09_10230, partial [Planctomycetota bacterium]|nr:hypothetical protein [Planctomycetota bacterium]